MAKSLTERYEDRLGGVLSCYDRIVITGTLSGVCYAQGMTSFPYAPGIRIFDAATVTLASQAGFRCFTDDAAFRRYVKTEVLAEINNV